MNYYPFHLGDYASHTLHLEPLEDIAYRRMLDSYYLREGPLPPDVSEVARLIRMKQNLTEVESVLREFFELTETGWRHSRCDDEIVRMQDKQAKAKASAQASVNARSTNAQRTLNERSTDVQLPTPTPTPTPEDKAPRKRVVPPDGVSDSVWQDFLTMRKAKKAPMTQAALDGIRREAEKAGWSLEDALRESCARGWQGFKADWVADKPKPASYAQQAADVARATVPAKQGPDPALQKIIEDRMKAVPPPADVREKLAALRGGS